jgi:hypothetical protein
MSEQDTTFEPLRFEDALRALEEFAGFPETDVRHPAQAPPVLEAVAAVPEILEAFHDTNAYGAMRTIINLGKFNQGHYNIWRYYDEPPRRGREGTEPNLHVPFGGSTTLPDAWGRRHFEGTYDPTNNTFQGVSYCVKRNITNILEQAYGLQITPAGILLLEESEWRTAHDTDDIDAAKDAVRRFANDTWLHLAMGLDGS